VVGGLERKKGLQVHKFLFIVCGESLLLVGDRKRRVEVLDGDGAQVGMRKLLQVVGADRVHVDEVLHDLAVVLLEGLHQEHVQAIRIQLGQVLAHEEVLETLDLCQQSRLPMRSQRDVQNPSLPMPPLNRPIGIVMQKRLIHLVQGLPSLIGLLPGKKLRDCFEPTVVYQFAHL